jgi:hypothetical protein
MPIRAAFTKVRAVTGGDDATMTEADARGRSDMGRLHASVSIIMMVASSHCRSAHLQAARKVLQPEVQVAINGPEGLLLWVPQSTLNKTSWTPRAYPKNYVAHGDASKCAERKIPIRHSLHWERDGQGPETRKKTPPKKKGARTTTTPRP